MQDIHTVSKQERTIVHTTQVNGAFRTLSLASSEVNGMFLLGTYDGTMGK